MIKLLSSLLAKLIEEGWVYSDRLSFEEATGTTKPKFKLANKVTAELCIGSFFVLTTNSNACSGHTTRCVKATEWTNVLTEYFPSGIDSYIDVKHVEVLSFEEIRKKRSDNRNGFKKMAMIPAPIIAELETLVRRALSVTGISQDKKDVLGFTIGEDIPERFLGRFGI